jgi:hypothetical protein
MICTNAPFSFVHQTCKPFCTIDGKRPKEKPFVRGHARMGFFIRAFSARMCRVGAAQSEITSSRGDPSAGRRRPQNLSVPMRNRKGGATTGFRLRARVVLPGPVALVVLRGWRAAKWLSSLVQDHRCAAPRLLDRPLPSLLVIREKRPHYCSAGKRVTKRSAPATRLGPTRPRQPRWVEQEASFFLLYKTRREPDKTRREPEPWRGWHGCGRLWRRASQDGDMASSLVDARNQYLLVYIVGTAFLSGL